MVMLANSIKCVYCGATINDGESFSQCDDGLHDVHDTLLYKVCKNCNSITTINKNLKSIIENADNMDKFIDNIEDELENIRGNKEMLVKYYANCKANRSNTRESGF